METLFIADDEAAIRGGIKCIIDWEEYGYTVCGEAATGTDALEQICELKPSLVLLDIRMPGLTGLEVVEQAVERGFKGQFIILSGYSDFKYAQSAIRLGVKCYLTKPLDEDELIEAVKSVTKLIHSQKNAQSQKDWLIKKSLPEILTDILDGNNDFANFDPKDFEFDSDIYQLVAYESFELNKDTLLYQFSELFKVASSTGSLCRFEHFVYNGYNLLLLCGRTAIHRFAKSLEHYETGTEKGSPLDSLFIAYGCTVNDLQDLHLSYSQISTLLSRRFFCTYGQHVLGYNDLPSTKSSLHVLDSSQIEDYTLHFTDYIQSFNRRRVAEELYRLEEYLYHVESDISSVKLFLTDLYLQIKNSLNNHYSDKNIPLASNSTIIAYISSRNYLYEIITYFSQQFEAVMNAIGNSSRDSVMDDILHYIDHNYSTNLKLEMIASLFGYNSSYLGKIFNKTVGESFNSYVDKIRINHAIEMLKSGHTKVYEIADKIGYHNVDYFHKKFKKYTGESPAEYRKKYNPAAEE